MARRDRRRPRQRRRPPPRARHPEARLAVLRRPPAPLQRRQPRPDALPKRRRPARARRASDSLDGERRLDFTLRRPIVSLSLVDASLDRGRDRPPDARRTSSRHGRYHFCSRESSAVVGPRWTTSPSSDRVFYRAFYDAVRADRPLGARRVGGTRDAATRAPRTRRLARVHLLRASVVRAVPGRDRRGLHAVRADGDGGR